MWQPLEKDHSVDPNYQLNRWHSLGLTRYEDIEGIGKRIRNFADWKKEMTALARAAEQESRLMNAAFYYRSAEFYTTDRDEPGKEYYYDRFTNLFYRAVEGEDFERIQVPFEACFLPVIRMTPVLKKKGTLLIHGGFDSFIEEWYYMMRYLSAHGYEVIGFEGPGQGHMIIKQGIPLDYRWEKPVGAILDHFSVEEATIIGLSMGGWFCLRAAAFEPRIKNVIASGHAIDYSRIPPPFMRWMMMFFIKHYREYTNRSFEKIAAKDDMKSWQVGNLAHITKRSAMEAFEYSLNLNQNNLHCEKINQNVLYFTGREDHFIPFKIHAKQLRLLSGAASLTDRVFTRKEHAQNHCQIGNVGLMLDVIVRWLEQRDPIS